MTTNIAATGIKEVDQTLVDLKNECFRPTSPEWDKSPYRWTLPLASGTKGRVGREVVKSFWETKGVKVSQNGHILVVGGKRVRVKFSNDWSGDGYHFEHIQQDCDYAFFLGVSPLAIHAWVFPVKASHGDLDPHYEGEGQVRMRPDDKNTWPPCLREQTGLLRDLTPQDIGIPPR